MKSELVQVKETTPLVSNTFNMVDVDGAKDFMDNYQDLVKALLEPSDYQMVKGVPKKKKSAWRKLATAFNITDEIVEKTIIREDNHQIISAWFMVKAVLPNGRSSIGVGDCSIFDKIKYDDSDTPSNFELRKRFNNAEHDVLTTAHTRAKSRAISDLIGGGEVSAEELEGGLGGKSSPKKTVKQKTTPKPKKVGKKKSVKPKKVDESEVIEAEIVSEGKPNTSKSMKDLMEENNEIKKAVKSLQEEERVVNRNTVRDWLLLQVEVGALSDDKYKEAVNLMDG